MVRIKNKRGIWRIVEAVVAVFILASAMALLFFKTNQEAVNDNDLDDILTEILKDQKVRESIVNDDDTNFFAENKVKGLLNVGTQSLKIKFNISICDASAVCPSDDYYPANAEVYTYERIISATVDDYNPKRLRIYTWRE